MTSLADRIRAFPRLPGVYLFKDAAGEILYVGKAKRLRDRVRSYFSKRGDERPQVRFLLKRTADIECIVTTTEREALLLENTLIKKHRPRYNIDLRDDKSYISIRISKQHPRPGISLTRKPTKDGALYFGPYDSSTAAREAVDQIIRAFQLRSCSDREFANRIRPCLKYDIGRCTAPCVGKISSKDYQKQVEMALMYFSGHSRELIRIVEERMSRASEEQRYEEAARLRDVIRMLRDVTERQSVVRHHGGDHDAIGLAREAKRVAICVLHVREGKLIGRKHYVFTEPCGEDASVVEEFLVRHYQDRSAIPSSILLPARPEGLQAVTEILGERRQGKVRLRMPARGDQVRLVELSQVNAQEALKRHAAGKSQFEVLVRLQRVLKLRHLPEVIECVDISNLSGREAVGSLVAFVGGEPERTRYRLYNIQTMETPDDYAMMFEVLSRRFRTEISLRRDTRKIVPPPDLLLVDGGKGQLAIALRALKECGVSVPVASIAKARPPREPASVKSEQHGAKDRGRGGQGEKKGHADQIFIPGRKNPLSLKRGSKELLLLMRIRDEAHRFGITAHRRRRGKEALASPLDRIRGIGPALRKRLLDHFGTLAHIRAASREELATIPGITQALAQKIKEAL